MAITPTAWGSLAGGWLPELHLVAFRIHHPAELAVLGVVRFLEYVAVLFAQDLEQRGQVQHAVVDHEARSARREVVSAGAADRPDCRAFRRVAGFVRPGERRAAPLLHVDAQVLLVPGDQRRGIPGFEEDAADARDSPHRSLLLLVQYAAPTPRSRCRNAARPPESPALYRALWRRNHPDLSLIH